jgi:hypothetical protein
MMNQNGKDRLIPTKIKLIKPSQENKEELSHLFHYLLAPEKYQCGREQQGKTVAKNCPGEQLPKNLGKMIKTFKNHTSQGFISATFALATIIPTALDDTLEDIVKRALEKLELKADYPYLAVAHWDANLQAHYVHIIVAMLDKNRRNKLELVESTLTQRWAEIGDEVAKEFGLGINEYFASMKGSPQQRETDKEDRNKPFNSPVTYVQAIFDEFVYNYQGQKNRFDSKLFAKQLANYLQQRSVKLKWRKKFIFVPFSPKNLHYQLSAKIDSAHLENEYSLKSICTRAQNRVNGHFKCALFLTELEKACTSLFGNLFRFFKKIIFVVLVMMMLLFGILFGIKTLFGKQPLQLILPASYQFSEFKVYDKLGELCDSSITSSSKSQKKYTIQCKQSILLPTQWLVETVFISGYKPISFNNHSLLQLEGNRYQVEESKLKPITQWPIFFTDNQALPFDKSSKVIFFESERECETTRGRKDWWLPYQDFGSPQQLEERPPRWAKIYDGHNKVKSHCAKMEELLDGRKLSVTFSFQPR